jgi:hypothetical protein
VGEEADAEEADRGIQNIAALSWLPGCPKPSWFAVLVAYMDESGTHDPTGMQDGSSVAGIAGYISTYKAWIRFQRKWVKALKHYRVRGRFHMKEYVAQHGEFEGWFPAKRKSLMAALCGVIDEHKLFGLGGIVSVKEYDSILPEWAKAEVKHPYYFCFAVLMKSLAQWSDHLPSGQIDFVFDRKEGFQGFGLMRCSTLSKKSIPHTQIDLVKSPSAQATNLDRFRLLTYWV